MGGLGLSVSGFGFRDWRLGFRVWGIVGVETAGCTYKQTYWCLVGNEGIYNPNIIPTISMRLFRTSPQEEEGRIGILVGMRSRTLLQAPVRGDSATV